MSYIVSIDQGTTSSRAVLVDKEGKAVAISSLETTQYLEHPGWVEQDPDDIFQTVLKTLKEVTKGKESEIEGVGITNQRETTILWDRETGKAVYRAIVWQSRQSESYVERIRRDKKKDWIHEKTGLIADAYFCATKIEWILDHVEGLRERAERGDILFGTVDCFLAWKLSKHRRHITDASNASRTMLFNIHENNWDEELLEYFNIPRKILPEVVDNMGPFDLMNDELTGLSCPLASLIGDQQSALYGQLCFEPGMVKQTYGTGGFALLNLGDQPTLSNAGLLTTVAWSLRGKLTYALEGSVFVAGSLIQWLRDQLGIIVDSSETEAIARSVSDNGGVVVVPAFSGLGAPYWDYEVRGSILGLTRASTKAHIVRASLEAIAFQTRDVLEVMKEESGVKLQVLKVDGGAAKNNYLMSFQSDILNTTLERMNSVEATALGAAFLAGLAVGFWKDQEELKDMLTVEKTFYPLLEKSERKKLIKRWDKAVAVTRRFV
ncbi:glycerol kinase GlpK [Guggenheimella bovis]